MSRYIPLVEHSIMEMWCFDTCNFNCGYCGLVHERLVQRNEQLDPFRKLEFIDKILCFFRNQRPAGRPWAVLLTGGEPLLMPNLDYLVRGLGETGDCVGIYSNLSAPLSKVLSPLALSHLAYVQASFHPDWHAGKFRSEAFFANVAEASAAGVPVVIRFVGSPHLLHLLPELAEKCVELGVGFLPTTLFDPKYPRSYTREQRATLASFMGSYSSLLQLDGGVNMRGRMCSAADRIFATRLHQGGDITPCISTAGPHLGNIFENVLVARTGKKPCFKPDQMCSCDIHFQQDIVDRADDSMNFKRLLDGEQFSLSADYDGWKRVNSIATSDTTWVGQGVTTPTSNDLLVPRTRPGAAILDSE